MPTRSMLVAKTITIITPTATADPALRTKGEPVPSLFSDRRLPHLATAVTP